MTKMRSLPLLNDILDDINVIGKISDLIFDDNTLPSDSLNF